MRWPPDNGRAAPTQQLNFVRSVWYFSRREGTRPRFRSTLVRGEFQARAARVKCTRTSQAHALLTLSFGKLH